MSYHTLAHSNLQVEVCVQNNFDLATLPETTLPGSQETPSTPSGDEAISDEQWENYFSQWLEILQEDLPTAVGYELSLRLTDDREIQDLNAQYRQKNQPTDVLAFASLEVDYPKLASEFAEIPVYLGDIVISVETANRQVQQNRHSLTTELAWLAAHGLLHLLGWDHPDEESLQCMLNQQQMMLGEIGLTVNSLEVT
jgi:probable rRNA maturation factor